MTLPMDDPSRLALARRIRGISTAKGRRFVARQVLGIPYTEHQARAGEVDAFVQELLDLADASEGTV